MTTLESSVEERVEILERLLGLDCQPNLRGADLDVRDVETRLREQGFQRLLTIPLDTLRQLRHLHENPENKGLDEKLNLVDATVDLQRQRALMLQQFQDALTRVLDSERLVSVTEHAAALDVLCREVDVALTAWERHRVENAAFREEFELIRNSIQEEIQRLEERVRRVQGKRASKEKDPFV